MLYAAPTLQSDSETATAGYFKLSWKSPNNTSLRPVTFELEQALSPSFSDARLYYVGSDTATVLSGLKSNTYHYRVRESGGDWSGVVSVVVQHHSLERAFLFFGLGAIVFVALLVTIIAGARSSD